MVVYTACLRGGAPIRTNFPHFLTNLFKSNIFGLYVFKLEEARIFFLWKIIRLPWQRRPSWKILEIFKSLKRFCLWVNNSLTRSEGRIISPLHFLLIRFFIYVSEKKYSRYCFVPVIALAKKSKKGNNSYSNNILKILINSNRGR